MSYLNQLGQSAVYSASRVRHYAGIVHERAQSRQLAAVVNDAREMATDHLVPIAERVEKVSAKLASLLDDAPGDEWVDSGTGMVEFMDALMERAEGKNHDFMPSGLTALDEQLDGGFREGELVIIGARPSMGKTALAVTIGMHAASTGHATAMFSLEMQRADLYTRQVAMVSNVSMSKIKRPERTMTQTEWSQMTEAVEFISHLPFYVNDKSNLNINTLRAKARALKRRFGLRLLIVDYLGLMEGTDPKAMRDKDLAARLGLHETTVAQKRVQLGRKSWRSSRAMTNWTPEVLAMLGAVPDKEIGARQGLHPVTVRLKRVQLGRESWESGRVAALWTPEALAHLGTMCDSQLAAQLNVDKGVVWAKRQSLDIPSVSPRRRRAWTEAELALLGTASDQALAEQFGCTDCQVRHARK